MRGRMMPSRKKDAMNNAIRIRPMTAVNHNAIRESILRFERVREASGDSITSRDIAVRLSKAIKADDRNSWTIGFDRRAEAPANPAIELCKKVRVFSIRPVTIRQMAENQRTR